VVGLLAQLVAAELARSEGLGIGGRAYEQAIQQERERLEFINRFVRHNLLNGLNLVNARAEHLEDAVGDHPDAEVHLDVIRSRVEEMSELVDTIRTFMNTVIDDSAALEPVALGPQLVDAVEDAAGRYNAAFTAHDFPDPDQRVVANDLLGEVFEQVLSNAIEHNDASDPAVEVWTSQSVERLPLSGGEAVGSAAAVGTDGSSTPAFQPVEPSEQRALTVHIADNGPGVDDETRQRMLSGSDAALDDPGHGFGFYLVRETMARYGGGVRVRENHPRGTVVELVFPLAE
jgi:signal transduction histidine kinase